MLCTCKQLLLVSDSFLLLINLDMLPWVTVREGYKSLSSDQVKFKVFDLKSIFKLLMVVIQCANVH